MDTSTYFFLFGSHPELSRAELGSVLAKPAKIATVWADGYELTADEAQKLSDRLGGSIKAAQLLSTQDHLSTPELQNWLTEFLLDEESKKIQFSITAFGRDHLPPIDPFQLKAELVSAGKKVRFREGSEYGLTAAVGLNLQLHEFLIFHTQDQTLITRTVAVQNIDAWTARDRGKPYADRKKGMLPPKLARMMVNLGLGDTDPEQTIIYDPFCGTGTVLMEAAMLGVGGYGSDLDSESARGTQQNLAWLKSRFETKPEYSVFEGDVSQVQPGRFTPKPNLIVTEPFLGRPKPKAGFVPGMMKGLSKLYLGAFKHWTRILDDQATVVMIFPVLEIDDHRYSLEKLIDKLAEIGYTTHLDPLEYGRPGAVVRRQIWRFTYQHKGK